MSPGIKDSGASGTASMGTSASSSPESSSGSGLAAASRLGSATTSPAAGVFKKSPMSSGPGPCTLPTRHISAARPWTQWRIPLCRWFVANTLAPTKEQPPTAACTGAPLLPPHCTIASAELSPVPPSTEGVRLAEAIIRPGTARLASQRCVSLLAGGKQPSGRDGSAVLPRQYRAICSHPAGWADLLASHEWRMQRGQRRRQQPVLPRQRCRWLARMLARPPAAVEFARGQARGRGRHTAADRVAGPPSPADADAAPLAARSASCRERLAAPQAVRRVTAVPATQALGRRGQHGGCVERPQRFADLGHEPHAG